jgi:hypothetical protein
MKEKPKDKTEVVFNPYPDIEIIHCEPGVAWGVEPEPTVKSKRKGGIQHEKSWPV